MNFAKTTPITNRVRLQVRLEAFNLLNSPQYDERQYNTRHELGGLRAHQPQLHRAVGLPALRPDGVPADFLSWHDSRGASLIGAPPLTVSTANFHSNSHKPSSERSRPRRRSALHKADGTRPVCQQTFALVNRARRREAIRFSESWELPAAARRIASCRRALARSRRSAPALLAREGGGVGSCLLTFLIALTQFASAQGSAPRRVTWDDVAPLRRDAAGAWPHRRHLSRLRRAHA